MSTVAQLDADLATAIQALPSTPIRRYSDYDDESGEAMTPGQWYYRLRLTAFQEVAIDSNTTTVVVQMELDLLLHLPSLVPLPQQERPQHATVWTDQVTLIDPAFYLPLGSVLTVPIDTVPQVTEPLSRDGNVLSYQVAANLVLQP